MVRTLKNYITQYLVILSRLYEKGALSQNADVRLSKHPDYFMGKIS